MMGQTASRIKFKTTKATVKEPVQKAERTAAQARNRTSNRRNRFWRSRESSEKEVAGHLLDADGEFESLSEYFVMIQES